MFELSLKGQQELKRAKIQGTVEEEERASRMEMRWQGIWSVADGLAGLELDVKEWGSGRWDWKYGFIIKNRDYHAKECEFGLGV